jgi:hypothetical protein
MTTTSSATPTSTEPALIVAAPTNSPAIGPVDQTPVDTPAVVVTVPRERPDAPRTLSFKATGFLIADATVHSTPYFAGSFTPDADGTIRATITLPADFELGDHVLELIGLAKDGTPLSKRTPFVLAPNLPPVDALAFTGTRAITAEVLLAILLIVVGVDLLRRSRLRGITTPTK